MIVPSLPEREADRLASLHALRLLDTPAEERFDRITRLATRIFGVPIAYVSLVDADRQWFKSRQGLPILATGRDISFCGHAILGKDTMVVPDTRLDPRFRDNPQVVGEPHLRFYAGHPLEGPGGHNIGTLCIADREPREFSENERSAFRELATIVERELNLEDVIRLQDELIRAREQTAASLRQALKGRERLTRELAEAARYVRSLLPKPLNGPVAVDWYFEPSSELGGDAFGYRWLDDDHFAFHLLDVSGHGVRSALLSVSVMEALRGLPDVDWLDPASVLAGLNQAFPMERHGHLYFTIWYGVYDRLGRRLDFATAGHPPALLIDPDQRATRLGEPNPAIGIDDDSTFQSESVKVPRGSRLFLFSDGVFEVHHVGGRVGRLDGFLERLAATAPARHDPGFPARTYHEALERESRERLADDFALLMLTFQE